MRLSSAAFFAIAAMTAASMTKVDSADNGEIEERVCSHLARISLTNCLFWFSLFFLPSPWLSSIADHTSGPAASGPVSAVTVPDIAPHVLALGPLVQQPFRNWNSNFILLLFKLLLSNSRVNSQGVERTIATSNSTTASDLIEFLPPRWFHCNWSIFWQLLFCFCTVVVSSLLSANSILLWQTSMADFLQAWLLCMTPFCLWLLTISDLMRGDFHFEADSSIHGNFHAVAAVAAAAVVLVVSQACTDLCMHVVGPPLPPPLGSLLFHPLPTACHMQP